VERGVKGEGGEKAIGKEVEGGWETSKIG